MKGGPSIINFRGGGGSMSRKALRSGAMGNARSYQGEAGLVLGPAIILIQRQSSLHEGGKSGGLFREQEPTESGAGD